MVNNSIARTVYSTFALLVIGYPYEDHPENFKAMEGYSTTLLFDSYGLYSLFIPTGIYIIFPYLRTRVFVEEQFNSDCKCWFSHETICHHNENSSSYADWCCRSKLTVHFLSRVNETGILYLWYNKNFTYQVAALMCK